MPNFVCSIFRKMTIYKKKVVITKKISQLNKKKSRKFFSRFQIFRNFWIYEPFLSKNSFDRWIKKINEIGCTKYGKGWCGDSENPKFFLLSHIPCRMHRPCFFRPFSQTNVLTHLRVEISLTKKLLLELFFPREERTWPMIPFRKVNLIGRFRGWISKKNYHSSSKRNLLIFHKLFFSKIMSILKQFEEPNIANFGKKSIMNKIYYLMTATI